MRPFLKAHWFKLLCLLVALVITGVVAFVVLTMRADRLQRESAAALKAELQQEEAEKRDYAIKRRSECLNIYEVEGKKYGNVREWRYNEEQDTCLIVYRDPDVKTAEQCRTEYSDEEGKLMPVFFTEYIDCLDGNFSKKF